MITKESPVEPGTLVKDYEIIEQVGKGGMGAVYRAKAPDGSIVALKILAAHLTDNDVQKKRFYQEAEVAMRLEHPNIVRAIEVGESDGRHFFAMEFVEGENLGKKIKDFGRLPEDEAVRIVVEVAEALEKAHQEGLIHRDVKPDNVMVTPSGTVKLADMGLMKQLDNDLNLTKTGKGLGTPHFMAPEQFRNAKNADARCDVYSLGATLYMMVTGELPFRGSGPLDAFIKKSKNEYKPPQEINPDLSPRLAQIIQMTMDADENKRPQSARALIELLKGKATIQADLWYVIFGDHDGKEQKVKGTTAAIEKQIERGRIGGDARVGRQKTGPFEPIRQIAAFDRALTIKEESSEKIPVSNIRPPVSPPQQKVQNASSQPLTPGPKWTIAWSSTKNRIAGAVVILCLLGIVAWLQFFR